MAELKTPTTLAVPDRPGNRDQPVDSNGVQQWPPVPSRVLWAPRDFSGLGPDAAEDLPRYREWVARREAERLAGSARSSPAQPGPAAGPELAILLVADDPDPGQLRRCLRSVGTQTVPRWRLSIGLVAPVNPAIEALLNEEIRSFPLHRAELRRLPAGTTRADAAQSALDAAGSPAFMLLDPGDLLAPDAVGLLAAGLVDADVAYADEDRLDGAGSVGAPVLKPDWSPELCMGWNYLGRPAAFRTTTVESAGGIRSLAGSDLEHDLVLRVTEHTDRVAHVAEVLCRRMADQCGGPPAGDQAVAEAIRRRGGGAAVAPGPLAGTWRVRWRSAAPPSVSAIVPFRDTPALLRACVDSVLATTAGVDLQLILVDNGSEEPETLTLLERLATYPCVQIIEDRRPFNWAVLNNGAAAAARGEVLLFLNNDIEAVEPGWLDTLAAQALRPAVGAAGARLVFPSGRLQHAGVVLGMAGAAGHVLVGLDGQRPGYLGMGVLARDCSAVTGACLATRTEVFVHLDGFDETLGVDLNDIDYCLRAAQEGFRVVYEPQAELVHHESPSRGTSGSAPDQLRFMERWEAAVTAGDPFLNPHLSRMECSAALRGSDEAGWWSQWRSNLTG